MTLDGLLKTIPASKDNVYSMCRLSGGKAAYKKWMVLFGNPAKMREYVKEKDFEEKMKTRRMDYYQDLEMILH